MSFRDRAVADRLRTARAPDEAETEQRAWRLVHSAFAEQTVVRRSRRSRRFALIPVVAVLAGVLVLTPAGATVHRWIERTLGVRHARAALFSLPAPGRILVSGPGGAWTVAADGAKRRLGPWRQATWSPHGMYVAVAGANELTAVDLRGTPRWALARPRVRFPEWFAPNGYRLAYLSGTTLRVVAGDSTGDRLLAHRVAPVAPAWRPGYPYQLAYVAAGGAVVVRDADTGTLEFSLPESSRPKLLSWSADGQRLLVLTRDGALVLSGGGRTLARRGFAPGQAPRDAALSPDGSRLALLGTRGLTLVNLTPRGGAARQIFSGDGLSQVAWSPAGDWLLVSWPAANQWIFIHATGAPRIIAVSRIAQQFTPSGDRPAFPQLDGWCCTSGGGAG
jgi:Lipoprotein LpqB beta-propeller domain